MNISIIKSNKGVEKLHVDGYFYYLENKAKKGTFNWACANE